MRLKAERAFRSAQVRLPRLTLHVIRHLHATQRVALAAELAQGHRERQRALVAAVQHDLFWQSSDTVQIYNHAISNADADGKLQTAYIDRLKSQPRSSGLRNRGRGWLRKHARGALRRRNPRRWQVCNIFWQGLALLPLQPAYRVGAT